MITRVENGNLNSPKSQRLPRTDSRGGLLGPKGPPVYDNWNHGIGIEFGNNFFFQNFTF